MKKNCALVSKKEAENLHNFLAGESLLDFSQKPKSNGGKVFFPLKRQPSAEQRKTARRIAKTASFSKTSFDAASEKKPKNLKDALRGKLSAEEMRELVRGFDLLGDIAIIEVPRSLAGKKRTIARALLESSPSVKTVCLKTGAHKGKYRIEPVKIIAGEKKRFALYKESGCSFRISLGKVFFSPRLSTERQRIASQIKDGEVVGAFFAGVGPFPIVFARNSPMAKAVAIELNPAAIKDLKFNVFRNKVSDKIEIIQGDVNKIVPKKFKGAFDRIVMPLPKGAETFLGAAFKGARDGCIVHFYQFSSAEKPFEEPARKIEEAARKSDCAFEIIFKRIVRTFSKDTVQVVIDFRVLKQASAR